MDAGRRARLWSEWKVGGEVAKTKAATVSMSWLPEPQEHDYAAAASYLTLVYDAGQIAAAVARLRDAPITQFKGKDIFRASQLSLLGVSNSHVEKDREKVRDGQSLSPLLLLKDEQHGKVVIADGYHRLCAAYGFDVDAWIDCKIV
jgi:hypothetical protein